MNSLCVFCGATFGKRPEYTEAARELGRLLAAEGIRLVYGGGHVGLMGVVADACIESGGVVWGVLPQNLADRELAHKGIDRLIVVPTLHDRKRLMNEHSDGFLVLPGGLGTLEELFEVLSWSQLGLIHKPTCLINVSGYWDPLLAAVDHQAGEGFISPESRGLLGVAESPPAALDELRARSGQWVDRWGNRLPADSE
jgi:hypothetical protein